MPHSPAAWWRTASIYQIYVRSFADGNGDGIGDVAGIRERLPYLRDLGVDALWLTPWYVSPMADAGYDVADYRDIDPIFGTLAEAEALIGEAHENGLRLIVDLVPNHCSDRHPWFREALAAAPGSAARERFWFVPGRGEHGELPPNDWQSYFGGPAWTRVTEADGSPGPWYLHMFAPQQPDLNWEHPQVREEFEDILRFWLDRGVDGFRIDVAHGLTKKPGLPDVGPDPDPADLPYQDTDGVHAIYRSWRAIIDAYEGERVFVGEVWLPTPSQFARYLRPDELHSAFNFEFLCCAWEPGPIREVIEQTLAAHAPVGAPPTWVLSNHDTIRHVTRYGRQETGFDMGNKRHGAPTDLDLGLRRARAAALLTLALPGGVYVYQGDELGLAEVEDIPDDLLQDPTWERSGHTDRGRDGCRVPLPWNGEHPPFGFSPPDAATEPWLPQPLAWKDTTVEAQTGEPSSMLSLYRAALVLRRTDLTRLPETVSWLDAGPGTVAFVRGDGFACVVNFSEAPIELPAHHGVLLASGPVVDGLLPSDTCVWLRLTPGGTDDL
ncbi:glycoside hydrolase family 13 protein [Streptosporangium sp. 'caverna']|uniref:glycoside hydrolase family 13 protein n=1 Tax=Streptosporangium sp. 'caverna' TaxID=2202249 RepID=UPI000D7D9F26|nr:glycoside hydrolase family 13 protein [Streptosporangium sp. 'caverna']AWS42306.1 alpha-glucosidase [Streptosporangium sp. 'caverna']